MTNTNENASLVRPTPAAVSTEATDFSALRIGRTREASAELGQLPFLDTLPCYRMVGDE